MATATVTPETNVVPVPASAVTSPSSTAPVESSSSSTAPETTSTSTAESQPRAAVPHEQSQPAELNPQDFDSLEDFAQALIDKKQSAVSTQQSEKADSSPASPDRNDNEVTGSQLQEASQESQPGA
ncbi:MAG TPA: hypothetical protein VJA94_04015, partial [Candidatus Angelobacter sp.]